MQQASDRWVSIALSVVLHGAILAALVYGWLLYRQPPRPAPTLAIEATVVDSHAARGALVPPPQPAPPAPPPAVEPPAEPVGPPEPTPEELAAREQQRKQEQAAADEQRRVAEQKAADEEAAKQAQEERKQAEAQRQARAAAEAQKRAAEQQRQADARDASEREADLKRSLAAEDQARAARSGPALANWQSQIAARINRAWLRPPTARPGIECVLNVTQVPGGEVTQVTIGECNGDQAVRESIEAAVYRASPLPPPPDPALFDRNLKINFRPD